MQFIKVKVRQASEGQPGFVAGDEFDVKIAPSHVTLFNPGVDASGKNITFVRLSCGATLCVVKPFNEFDKLLSKAK